MFQTNFELRRLAREKGPSEEEFTRLANSVDQFTSCLLDPLKSHTEASHAFGDSLDDVMDAGIEWEQKKVRKPFCRLDSIWHGDRRFDIPLMFERQNYHDCIEILHYLVGAFK